MTIVASINNDIIIPTVAGETYQGLDGDDTYILTNSLQAGDAITIDDTQGSDRIQLVDGLAIASTTVYQDAVQLVLTSGAIVNILSAGNFTFEPGGNATSGETGTDRTFAEFVVEDLGATVPAAGADPVTGGAATIGESAGPTFELTQDATAGQVNEGSTVTYTITASENLAADTTFTYEISSTEASAADFSTATSGTVTIPAGSNTATFQVTPVAGDGPEFSEDFTVTITDSSGAAVGTLDSVIIDTSTADNTAPVVDAAQTFNYDENQAASTAVLGTVTASDNAGGTGVAGFAITGGNEDGFFAINANGELTLTADGLTAASNDFETAPNSFGLMVTATDGAGNTSAAVDVTLEIDDVDDVAPTLSSATLAGTTATLTFSEPLGTSTPSASDFAITVKGAASSVSINQVTVTGSTVQLELAVAPAAGQTFQVAYTPGLTPLEDVSGNDTAAFPATDIVLDTTAPVVNAGQTFSYEEGQHDDTNDVVGQVLTDDASAGTFVIESGDANNFFDIDNTGNITLTTAGLLSSAASNDFETTPNSFTLGISATDGAGNKSATETVTINVTDNVDDNLEAPIITSLTTNADPVPPAVLGSNNDDIISGVVNNLGTSTFTAADFINTGDHLLGDTLQIELNGASYAGGATIQNVEILKVTASTAHNFNANGMTSLTKVVNNASAQNTTINNLASSVLSVEANTIQTGNGAGTFGWAAGALTGAETLTLTTSVVGTSAAAEAITVGPTVAAANSFGTIDLVANGPTYMTLTTDATQTSIKTINASGSGVLQVALAADKIATTATTIDASQTTGGFTLTGLGAVNHMVTGGSGNDLFNFGANLNTGDTIDGGSAGTDTLAANGADMAGMTAAAKATVSNIDTLFMNDDVAAVPTTVVGTLFGSDVSNVRIADQGTAGVAAVTFNALVAADAGSSNNIRFDGDVGASGGAYTFGITNAQNAGTANAVTLDMRGGALTATSTFTMQGVEDITIDTTNATGAKTFNITDTALQALTVKGGQDVDINGALLGAGVTTVDGSGLTGVAALDVSLSQASASGVAVTTAGGADIIAGSQLNDTIIAGGGADTIDGEAGADYLDGGSGIDAFTWSLAGDTGNATYGGTSTSTATLDIVAVTTGDTLDLTAPLSTDTNYDNLQALQSAGNLSAVVTANNIGRVTGTYDSAANTFTVGTSGNAVMLFWDTGDGVAADEAIVLTGVTDVSAILNGVVTV